MPPRGKESIIRRRKEIERQAKQKEKQARRDERRTQPGGKGPSSKGDISPEDLVSIEELTGLRNEPDAPAEGEEATDGAEASAAGTEAHPDTKPEGGV